jgi:hypothetical protein
MENPLLEEIPVAGGTLTVGGEWRRRGGQGRTPERDDPLSDLDVEKFFEDYLDDRDRRRTRPSRCPEAPPIENTLTEIPDLYDHLSGSSTCPLRTR